MQSVVGAGLLVFNSLTFLTYVLDKHRARKHQWRISEKQLLIMTVLGGGVGGFLAGQIVRHKIRKWYFWLAWILGIFLDIWILSYLIT